jgi:hypothetical protein
MDFNTIDRMEIKIYRHTEHNSYELVFGIENVQGDNTMGRVDPKV